ncbi:hypothetical protein PR048_033084 [Dryococelus australis]|uniref:Uncharacterized protein n=1 Tax=Dryococelus australis TaxID=614101 RepID=A0ABQ9FZ82_9NEOP|nr:hypothetical protein PR048_033084 [Dryococelus australis]
MQHTHPSLIPVMRQDNSEKIPNPCVQKLLDMTIQHLQFIFNISQ